LGRKEISRVPTLGQRRDSEDGSTTRFEIALKVRQRTAPPDVIIDQNVKTALFDLTVELSRRDQPLEGRRARLADLVDLNDLASGCRSVAANP
jgi:hypothetical protein